MLDDQEFRRLLDHFDRPWAGYRKVRRGVKKRIRRHMEDLGCGHLDAYLALIEQRPEERRACLQHLSVSISRFMRDRKMWSCLAERCLPELARRFPKGPLAWSAGCANGEEPYSLALVWQAMAEIDDPPPITILATDLRPDCLVRAGQGQYGRGSLKELAPEVRERFFEPLGARQYRVRPILRAPIRWRQHDLLSTPPGHHEFHLILLRNNLLTYYRGDVLRHAFSRIIGRLATEGWLAVGSHEHPPDTWDYRLERDPQCPWLYQKRTR